MTTKKDRLAHRLFVVSDLHLGGKQGDDRSPEDRGFSLCTRTSELASFIDWLAMEPKAPTVELVIAGDFLDFIAEKERDTWQAFRSDPGRALCCFETIVKRNKLVFTALAGLIDRGHALTILLGNHDLELSLPPVRRALRQVLGIKRHHQFKFIYDNEAYTVGPVLIEHGNRYDGFNTVDHDALRRLRSCQSRNMDLPEELHFTPPVGSQLVAEIMNPIKREYPFVDLLKPETEAVIPLLLALEPDFRKHITKIGVMKYKANRRNPALPGQPARKENIGSAQKEDERAHSLEDVLDGVMTTAQLEEFLQALPEHKETGRSSVQNISASKLKRALSFSKLLVAPGEELDQRMPALFDALSVLIKDRSFETDGPEEKHYLEAARELVGYGAEVVVFGHTHLARDLSITGTNPLKRGRAAMVTGRYINTGTWADLMAFPLTPFDQPRDKEVQALKEVVTAMRDRRFSRWVKFLPHYAAIELDADLQLLSAKLQTVGQ